MTTLNAAARVAADDLPTLAAKYMEARAAYVAGVAKDGPYDVADELCEGESAATLALAEAMKAAGVEAVRHAGGLVVFEEPESYSLKWIGPDRIAG